MFKNDLYNIRSDERKTILPLIKLNVIVNFIKKVQLRENVLMMITIQHNMGF